MKTKTPICLERHQRRALKARARADGISLTELVRRLADAHMSESEPQPAVTRATSRALVGIGASGRRDVADNHDALVARALRRKHPR